MAAKKDQLDPELEAIKAIIRAVSEELKEVARMQKENAQQLDKQRAEADRRQAEIDRRQEEVDRRQEEVDRRQAEANRRQAEIDRQQAKTDRLLRRLGKQIGGQGQRWGKIIESLVEGDLCALMTEFLGIEIVDISRRVEVRGVEIDLVAVNTDTVVVVEVKTTLQREHIDKFIDSKLSKFTALRPHYKGSKVYGVIAFVKVDSNAREVIDDAIGKGLIVIKAMRGTNHIINPKDCTPRNFHP